MKQLKRTKKQGISMPSWIFLRNVIRNSCYELYDNDDDDAVYDEDDEDDKLKLVTTSHLFLYHLTSHLILRSSDPLKRINRRINRIWIMSLIDI